MITLFECLTYHISLNIILYITKLVRLINDMHILIPLLNVTLIIKLHSVKKIWT